MQKRKTIFFLSILFIQLTLFWSLTSAIQNNSNIYIPSQSDFYFTNGSIISVGDLHILDNNCSTFNSSESGHFPATYSFKNDEIGLIPSGWINESGNGCSTKIIQELDGHKKVLDLYDNSSQHAVIYKEFDSQISGTIEWWWRVSDINKTSELRIVETPSSIALGFTIKDGRYFACNSTGYVEVKSAMVNQWDHHRVDFNCTTNKYNWYINQVKEIDQEDFINPVSGINVTGFITYEYYIDYHFYLDAIGFSWNGYNVGENIISFPSELNFTLTKQLTFSNNTIESLNLSYAYNTSNYQIVNLSIYNFDNLSWVLINSRECYIPMHLTHWEIQQSHLNQSLDFLNSSNYVKIKISAINSTEDFNLYVDTLKIKYNLEKAEILIPGYYIEWIIIFFFIGVTLMLEKYRYTNNAK